MTEEQLTKHILRWLRENEWEIISFDFPQSGTGIMIHPDVSKHKNKKGIILDVIAFKKGICLFFENKDRFYLKDFEKQNELIKNKEYENSIYRILENYDVSKIYYGIGLPSNVQKGNLVKNRDLVDFIVTVDSLSGRPTFFHDKHDKHLIKRLFL